MMANSHFSVACALVALLLITSCTTQDRPDLASFESEFSRLIQEFDGRAGIYVKDLVTGKELAINADTLYPTASMIKVPIMVAVFDRIERGELDYQQKLVYRDSLFYSDGDVTGEFRDSATVSLAEMVMLSISKSDNTASLWLQELAGTGTMINEWLDKNGFVGTRMNSRTPERRGDWEVYGWGQTTPREMARLVELIWRGEAVSPAASEEMLRVLSRPYYDDEAISQIPPSVQVSSKTGAVNASKSEVIIVHAPSGPYLFCVITADQTDTQWAYGNAGYELIRAVSSRLWNAFEPDMPWQSATGIERYRGSDE